MINQAIPNNNLYNYNNVFVDVINRLQYIINDIYSGKQADVIINQINNVKLIMNNLVISFNQNI